MCVNNYTRTHIDIYIYIYIYTNRDLMECTSRRIYNYILLYIVAMYTSSVHIHLIMHTGIVCVYIYIYVSWFGMFVCWEFFWLKSNFSFEMCFSSSSFTMASLMRGDSALAPRPSTPRSEAGREVKKKPLMILLARWAPTSYIRMEL